MARRPNHDPSRWKKFHDPDATEADYQRWREEHHARVLKRALEMLGAELPVGANSERAAARSIGLHPSTLARYRNKERAAKAKRGPLLTTYLMLRGR